ncbi:MAG TPA: dephospho-CoA kinase [Usitatibacteraceae bacterium]|nr:dephospho-CoA kinase [Usitatibacteraceae bacterium]
MKRTVGLTGGIGSGKSTAAGFLAELGATVVDADDISRELTAAGGAALPALREAFGERFVPAGGALDRAAMRALAFSDSAVRARLEGILHPLIRAESKRRLAAATGPYAVLVVPLLFESGSWTGQLDRVVVVDLDGELQVRRAAERSRLSPDEVRAIMAAQWPRWRRLQAADEVLWNGGDPAALRAQCERLHARLCGAGANA